MGVIYKLRDEVVHFIISQRQSNPLASCRQLAESTSQKFGLQLSKSSVHDVLKESGIMTPRGRKPKDKFEIPKEKKKQIQTSLTQVKLLPDPVELKQESAVAGNIFLKAALWDMGIFTEADIKETDWEYYLTYIKGIKVVLENDKSFFIELPLPLERCIREMADGLVNNIRPFIAHKISDEGLFKACMEAQAGFKISNISIVGCNNHKLLEINNIVEYSRTFILINRIYVESNEKNVKERAKTIFFTQLYDNNTVMDNILNLKGFNATNAEENMVTLLIDRHYENKDILEQAAEKLNGMYIYDEQSRLVRVKIQ